MATASGTVTVNCASLTEKQTLVSDLTNLIGNTNAGINAVHDGADLSFTVDLSFTINPPGA